MILKKNIGWLKEFLFERCIGVADRAEAQEILESFRKLWHLAMAAEQNPYPRSPRLEEALAAVKDSVPGKETFKRPSDRA